MQPITEAAPILCLFTAEPTHPHGTGRVSDPSPRIGSCTTRCRELVSGWPDYIGIVNAFCHGVGGVVIGELSACTPVVFQWEWPDDIKQNIV